MLKRNKWPIFFLVIAIAGFPLAFIYHPMFIGLFCIGLGAAGGTYTVQKLDFLDNPIIPKHLIEPPRFTKAGRNQLIHNEEMRYMQHDIRNMERGADDEYVEMVQLRTNSGWYHKNAKDFISRLERREFVAPGMNEEIYEAENPKWRQWLDDKNQARIDADKKERMDKALKVGR